MRTLCLAALVLVSCGGSSSDAISDSPMSDSPMSDALPADASLAALSCSELVTRAAPLAPTLDATCSTVDDCMVVGAPESCNCAPSLAGGSGFALSKAGAASAELRALASEYTARCRSCGGGNPCVCDAAPALLSCDGGHCAATPRSCLVPPADAGK
jgi:hypothetical protein